MRSLSYHQYQCKNLKREEVKQWLHDMLKLLNQKSDQNLESEKKRLEALHQRHIEMLPGIEENMRKVGPGGRGIGSQGSKGLTGSHLVLLETG